MFNGLCNILLFSLAFMATSCVMLEERAGVTGGVYSTVDSQEIPREAFHMALNLDGCPACLKDYLQFWESHKNDAVTMPLLHQGRAILYRIMADLPAGSQEMKELEGTAMNLEHAELLLAVSNALSSASPSNTSLESILDTAARLQRFREHFPQYMPLRLAMLEQSFSDPFAQDFLMLFNDADPVALLSTQWTIQTARDFKASYPEWSSDIPDDRLCLSATYDVSPESRSQFLNFRGLPPEFQVAIQGKLHPRISHAASKSFRLPIPSYDKTDGRVTITLAIPAKVPPENILTPWLSTLTHERRDRGRKNSSR